MKSNSFDDIFWPVTIVVTIIVYIALISQNFYVQEFDYSICEDGSISYSEGRGVCSHHGGVDEEVYRDVEGEINYISLFTSLMISVPVGIVLGLLISFFINNSRSKQD